MVSSTKWTVVLAILEVASPRQVLLTLEQNFPDYLANDRAGDQTAEREHAIHPDDPFFIRLVRGDERIRQPHADRRALNGP